MDEASPSIFDIHSATAPSAAASTMEPDVLETTPDASGTVSAQLEWHMDDAASLAPRNVQIAKAQRAWERKPSSPFARRRFKVGKIMKRAAPVFSNAPASAFNVHIREPAPAHAGAGTPLKVVKKMRIGSDGLDKVTSVVSNWDERGSPQNRRIVTRSSRGEEDLVALTEDEGTADIDQLHRLGVTALVEDNQCQLGAQCDPEGTEVEIFDESGTKMVLAAGFDEEEHWTDASDDASDTEDVEDSVNSVGTTLQHPLHSPQRVDASADADIQDEADLADDATEVDDEEESAQGWQKLRDELPEERRKEAASLGMPLEEYLRRYSPSSRSADARNAGDETTSQVDDAASVSATERLSNVLSIEHAALPAGFVSPAVARRRPISQVKPQIANRRRTLPKDFAANGARHAAGAQTQKHVSGDDFDKTMPGDHQDSLQNGPAELTPEQVYIQRQRQTTFGIEHIPPNGRQTPSPIPASVVTNTNTQAERCSPIATEPDRQLPLRRSPRRQSSSPFERKSILKSSQKPHLVAFTPIQRKVIYHDAKSKEPEQPARSSSAPPEELQIVPRKHQQPRISDDTALLEAFLKRASESKNGRRVSETARRESLERQVESSIVPQALAGSPIEHTVPKSIDVLGDLDPNSPSPRKASMSMADMFLDDMPIVALSLEQDVCEDDRGEHGIALQASLSARATASRKSGRTKRKPETLSPSAYSGPAKISIKGRSDGVVLKQTDAQKLAVETRKNTKGNKTGSVMPQVRLRALREEAEARAKCSPNIASEAMEVDRPAGRKGIAWAQTLVSFYGGENSEMSSMGEDTSIDPLSIADDTDSAMESVSANAPPPALETPSKPRLRRLKPSRTASTPSRAPAAPAPPTADHVVSKPTDTPEVKRNTASSTTRRKISRLATPAKLKTDSKPSIDENEGIAVAADEIPLGNDAAASNKKRGGLTKKSIPTPLTKTKSVVTRLPAPAVSLPMAGKENNLIASPPKKRMTKTSADAAAAPMKLSHTGEPKSLAPAPRFDIHKVSKNYSADSGGGANLISSPPKKVARFMPGREVARGIVLGVGGGIDDQDIQHSEVSLRSPAKKRSGRKLLTS